MIARGKHSSLFSLSGSDEEKKVLRPKNEETRFICKIYWSQKTCCQNKSKFNTEDYFVQHMNITIYKV